jgi:hypothetical protein
MSEPRPAPARHAGLPRLIGVALAVFVLTFSLVPLYRIACEKVFGVHLERGPGEGPQAGKPLLGKRTVKVEFDGGVNSKLPWSFHPEQLTMQVVPGELNEALYYARNDSDRALVGSAVPLVEAIHAAAAVTPNHWVRARALHVAQRVREGVSLRAAMTEAGVFPSMLIAIVASGESSGRLAPALGRAAGELERELDGLVTALVALVEPLVLLVMGGLVLLMVLSILLPIINLNNLVTL